MRDYNLHFSANFVTKKVFEKNSFLVMMNRSMLELFF